MAGIAWMLVLSLSCILQLSAQQGADQTLKSQTYGADVVQAVIDKIQGVFGSDRQFLRRITFVESKDGTDSNTFRSGYHGGIWQVDEVRFSDTQDIASHPGLSKHYDQIMNAFEIDWITVQWTDLRIPLYSGLAARLLLLNVNLSIPCDLAGQAAYWKLFYNTEAGAGAEQKFIDDAESLGQGCRINSDVMLVLDASGSIGATNFESVRRFALQYVDSLTIGPNDNQVGVITFSSTAQLEFGLDTHSDNRSLQQAISNVLYTGGSTNIPDALCQLITVFSSNTTGARFDPSVFRVAILMTDGRSNRNANPCSFSSVSEAAMAVHAVSPPILVFAFGVGSGFNQQDVIDIASGPEFVSEAQSFGPMELDCVQTVQEEKICNSISTPVELEAENRGSLEKGEQIRWKLEVPQSGTYLKLEVDEGEVALYGSTETSAPNEAYHQWKINSSLSTTVHINPTAQNGSDTIQKRNVELNDNETLITVYTAIFGLSASNTFTLTSDDSPPIIEQMTTTASTTEESTASTEELDENTMLPSPSGDRGLKVSRKVIMVILATLISMY